MVDEGRCVQLQLYAMWVQDLSLCVVLECNDCHVCVCVCVCVRVAFTYLHGVQHERGCLLQTTPHNMHCVHVRTVCARTAFIAIIVHVTSVHLTHHVSLLIP
jgi:hypothetical protein